MSRLKALVDQWVRRHPKIGVLVLTVKVVVLD